MVFLFCRVHCGPQENEMHRGVTRRSFSPASWCQDTTSVSLHTQTGRQFALKKYNNKTVDLHSVIRSGIYLYLLSLWKNFLWVQTLYKGGTLYEGNMPCGLNFAETRPSTTANRSLQRRLEEQFYRRWGCFEKDQVLDRARFAMQVKLLEVHKDWGKVTPKSIIFDDSKSGKRWAN